MPSFDTTPLDTEKFMDIGGGSWMDLSTGIVLNDQEMSEIVSLGSSKPYLEKLATFIRDNLMDMRRDEYEYKWRRAILYHTARGIFTNPRSFRQWLQNEVQDRGCKVDPPLALFILLQLPEHFTEGQFILLGAAKAGELVQYPTSVIRAHPEEWNALVSIAHKLSLQEIRERMRQIKKGETPPIVTPEQERIEYKLIKEVETLGLKVDSLTTQLGALLSKVEESLSRPSPEPTPTRNYSTNPFADFDLPEDDMMDYKHEDA